MANWREMGEENILREFEEFYNKKNIEEQCTEEDLMNFHEAFLAAEGEVMSKLQFKEAFRNILKIHISDEEFLILFAKINLKRDGYTTWDEFITYLLLEFQQKDTTLQLQTLELPLTGEIEVKKTHHRNAVCRIIFCPEIRSDRTWDFSQGCYLTASRDGMINYWSLDLEYERSVHSTNPYLKVCPTTITDMIVLPDIQIVCTSSLERDLRFYDTVAKKFDLRIIISSLENAVVCMNYYFSRNIKENSRIVLGDMGGTVKVLSFSSLDKGPFKHDPRHDLIHLRYEAVARGELQGMKVKEFKNIHADWVRQVGYYGNLRAFISCGICSDHSVFLSDATGTKMQYIFNVAKGVSCFDFCEEGHILVTGGPDCVIRIWNPFVPYKPNCIFQGHHATICALVIQNAGRRIYSLAKDKCLKVWDVAARACIQTYNGLPSELGEHTPISVVYNLITRKMIISSMKIVILTCEHVINEEISDGQTHAKPVSCVLYNTLFKVVVTTGLDSCIIVWNPWLGRRLYLRRNAHYNIIYGEKVPVEITAASFDTSEHLLLTGARDGTIKMWNFNSGTCIRNMSIEAQCEITSIIWLSNRILCTGWNRHITEFADTETGVHTKSWETRHTDDVLCTAVSPAQTLATASYNGELILWRLETGQPYRRYRVNNPTGRYAIPYKKEPKAKAEPEQLTENLIINKKTGENKYCELDIDLSCTPDGRGISEHQKSALSFTRTVGVYAIIFLNSRPVAPDVGSLLLSLENGMIQVWTHHPAAGFLISFSAVHTLGDYAMSLATDPENKYLITGHTAGYIKVWLLTNYAVPDPPDLCIARLKLKFPFLWKDRIDGRAKRAVRNQPLPILLSSVRAHCKTINSLQYIPESKLILSGSSDHTVRLWTLSGRYISTLGTFRPWSTLLPNTSVQKYFYSYRLPPDIKRVGSFTTMKVLNGGQIEQKFEGKTEEAEMLKEVPEHERYMLYGTRLSSPKLGRYYKLPERSNAYGAQPVLDSSLAYIPVYTHLVTHDLEPIKIPPVPSLIQKTIPVLHSKIRTRGVPSPVKEAQRNLHAKTEKSTEVEDSSQTNQSRSSH